MKKFIAFIGFFAFVLAWLPCNVAHASVTVPKEVIDSAIEKNYGIDNIVLFLGEDGNYILLTEKSRSSGTDAPYNEEVYKENSWRYVEYDGRLCFVSPSWWSLQCYKYINGKWEAWQHSYGSTSSTYATDWNPSTLVYASKNIYYNFGELDGEIFFRGAPVLTELAMILEQSNRQTSPMCQVIFLLPLGISLVVSFLALRKFFKMLQTILSGA